MPLGRVTITRTLLLVLLAASAAAVLSFRGIYEPDLWWHLAQGREAAAGRLVHTNLFNFIYPDYPQPYTPWLFDLAGYLAWQAGRGAGIQIAQAALLASTFALMYLACRERADPAAALSILVLGFFVVEPRAIPRPHLATFAGMAACALLIERARRTRRAAPLLWAVPIVALWSNLHVECIFGVLLVAIFAGAEFAAPSVLPRPEARRALAIAAACLAATIANPYGWGLMRYLVENWQVPRVLDIAELLPPLVPRYRAFFLYVALAALLLLWRPRTTSLWEWAAATVFAVLGARFLRFTPLVLFATAPLLAERLGWMIERGIDRRAMAATAIAAGLVTSRLPVRSLIALSAGTPAVAPAEFFSPGLPGFARRTGLHGPVFNSMNLGGYLAWALYPDTRIFQDGRLQAVPPEHFRAILEASRSQAAWNALVARVDWAVLSLPRPNELSGAGRFPREEWATVYWDEAVEVVVRRTGQFASVAAAHEYELLLPASDPILLAGRLAGPDGDRLREESRRNMTENPDGFAAPAVLCLAGDRAACEHIERLAARHPRFRDALSRVRLLITDH
jgi:hypothetical protein